MKHFCKLVFPVLFLLFVQQGNAQEEAPRDMFRAYEENDFFNIAGGTTDKAYTNGSRLDFFYEQQKTHGLLHRLMPKAGTNSENVYGWGLMQIMVTPHDISVTSYQPNDFYYAGALFATHSLYSYNPVKRYSFQTQLLAGIRGPASFAKQTQKAIHRLFDYQEPMGWKNQLKTQPLLNITFAVEKELFSISDFVELNVGSQIRAGSFMDQASFYPMLRIGKMSPYFDGLISQYGSFTKNGKPVKSQYYFVVKPALSLVAYNAMLKGTRNNRDKDPNSYTNTGNGPSLHNHITDLQFGAVVAYGRLGLSIMQTNTSAYDEGLDNHSYGNISLYFRL